LDEGSSSGQIQKINGKENTNKMKKKRHSHYFFPDDDDDEQVSDNKEKQISFTEIDMGSGSGSDSGSPTAASHRNRRAQKNPKHQAHSVHHSSIPSHQAPHSPSRASHNSSDCSDHSACDNDRSMAKKRKDGRRIRFADCELDTTVGSDELTQDHSNDVDVAATGQRQGILSKLGPISDDRYKAITLPSVKEHINDETEKITRGSVQDKKAPRSVPLHALAQSDSELPSSPSNPSTAPVISTTSAATTAATPAAASPEQGKPSRGGSQEEFNKRLSTVRHPAKPHQPHMKLQQQNSTHQQHRITIPRVDIFGGTSAAAPMDKSLRKATPEFCDVLDDSDDGESITSATLPPVGATAGKTSISTNSSSASASVPTAVPAAETTRRESSTQGGRTSTSSRNSRDYSSPHRPARLKPADLQEAPMTLYSAHIDFYEGVGASSSGGGGGGSGGRGSGSPVSLALSRSQLKPPSPSPPAPPALPPQQQHQRLPTPREHYSGAALRYEDSHTAHFKLYHLPYLTAPYTPSLEPAPNPAGLVIAEGGFDHLKGIWPYDTSLGAFNNVLQLALARGREQDRRQRAAARVQLVRRRMQHSAGTTVDAAEVAVGFAKDGNGAVRTPLLLNKPLRYSHLFKILHWHKKTNLLIFFVFSFT
jgi:hypothetical protein